MNPTDLQSLSYPIYKLPDAPNVDDGVIYYYSEIEKEDVIMSKLLIVDDINAKGDTLAKRRLQLMTENVPLYRLRHAIFFLGDLIKIATPSTSFIDSNGKLFNYKKTTMVKLKFYRIDNIFPIRTGGAIVALDGIPSRFKVLDTPMDNVVCAGVLHNGMSNILYGLYDHIPTDSRRMI